MERVPDTMQAPAAVWWRQRSVLWTEGTAFVMVGLAIVVNFLPGSRYWIGLTAGALIGLAVTLALGGLFTIHDAWELHRKLYQIWLPAAQRDRRDRLAAEARADNAFGLGYAVSQRPTSPDEITEHWRFLASFCQALSLPLGASEWSHIRAASDDVDELASVSTTIRGIVDQYAPREWWCFFSLGATIAWLTDALERHQNLYFARSELEGFQANPTLDDDPRYAEVAEKLSRAFAVIDGGTVLPAQRAQLVEDVNNALRELPEAQVEFRQTPFAIPVSDWYWTDTDGEIGAMCFVGDRSVYAASATSYEVGHTGPDGSITLTRNGEGWGCSKHGELSATAPCTDLDLVLATTNGGEPITQARLVLVRDDET
jgi:hypothetical protein